MNQRGHQSTKEKKIYSIRRRFSLVTTAKTAAEVNRIATWVAPQKLFPVGKRRDFWLSHPGPQLSPSGWIPSAHSPSAYSWSPSCYLSSNWFLPVLSALDHTRQSRTWASASMELQLDGVEILSAQRAQENAVVATGSNTEAVERECTAAADTVLDATSSNALPGCSAKTKIPSNNNEALHHLVLVGAWGVMVWLKYGKLLLLLQGLVMQAQCFDVPVGVASCKFKKKSGLPLQDVLVGS